MNIFVLTWKYSDMSGFGIVKAFELIEDAEKLMKILNEHSGIKQFDIITTELVEE